jgi:hypothetical protein
MLWPAVGAIVALVILGGVVATLTQPPSDQAVAGITDAPGATVGIVAPGATSSTIGPSLTAATAVASSAPDGGPTATPRSGGTPGPGATPRPTHTPRPSATPRGSLAPTPVPTPTPTPEPMCTVVSLIGINTSSAQQTWSGAGFSGTVVFSPTVPPNYRIGWQSLTAKTLAPCTSGITVMKAAP